MGGITPPDYPTLFFFEVGQWWDYAMLLLVIVLELRPETWTRLMVAVMRLPVGPDPGILPGSGP